LVKELSDAQALEGTGFDAEALEKLLGEAAGTNGNTDPDEVPEERPTDIKLGDMFRLGDHLLMCGDSTRAEDVDRLMGGALADICWTDPPWNIAYDGEVSRGRKSKNRAIANDNLGSAFPAFCAAFAAQVARALKPGGLLYLAMSAQEWGTVHATLVSDGFHWSSTLVWAKDVFNVGRKDYHAQYEPIWYGWKDGAPRLHPLEDRSQSDVWNIPRPKRSDEHPTMKPVELVARALTNSSKPGALCFEPFSGSGTTLLACEKMGRACRAIELEPKYVQVAIDRWEAFTGRKAEKLEAGHGA
jgi:DNA modification methylase